MSTMNFGEHVDLNISTHNITGHNSSTGCSDQVTLYETAEFLFQANDIISKVLPPIFLTIGIPGNLLTITVIIRQRKTITYTAVALLFVAVADLITLLSHYLPEWIAAIAGLGYTSVSRSFCLLLTFFLFSSNAFTPWGLVAITVERVICVVKPFDAKRIFTPKFSLALLSAMSFVILVLSGYVFVDDISERDEFIHGMSCALAHVDYEGGFSVAWILIISVLSCYIPFALLSVGNFVLVWKLYIQKKVTSSGVNQANQMHRLCILVITLNAVFFISQFPIVVLMYYWEDLNDWMSVAICSDEFAYRVGVARLSYSICNVCAVLNPSINYLLYFVSSPRFRKEIKTVCQCHSAGSNNIFAQ